MAETEPKTSPSDSSSSNNGNEVGDFECNICFDVAQDPVITLCGHLYCWPCLHKWLCLHSHSHECPVCKALVQEEKVIPLYGRGKTPTDPRSKPVPGVQIPNRPAGQRPETAPSPVHSNLSDLVFGLMGGFMPVATASFGNFGMSVSLGGVFSPLFVSINGFPGIGGRPPVYRDSIPRNSRGMNGVTGQADDENLKKIFLIIFIFVVITLFML